MEKEWQIVPKVEQPRSHPFIFFPSLEEFILGHKEWLLMFEFCSNVMEQKMFKNEKVGNCCER